MTIFASNFNGLSGLAQSCAIGAGFIARGMSPPDPVERLIQNSATSRYVGISNGNGDGIGGGSRLPVLAKKVYEAVKVEGYMSNDIIRFSMRLLERAGVTLGSWPLAQVPGGGKPAELADKVYSELEAAGISRNDFATLVVQILKCTIDDARKENK